MKNILILLSLSLSVMAIDSVCYASPPAQVQHPTIKKAAAVAVPTFATTPILCFTVQEFDVGQNVSVIHLDAAMHGVHVMHLMPQLHNTGYVEGYGVENRSLCNYWQGPPPYGNA